MDNNTRKKDTLVASVVAGILAGLAISLTLYAIYHNSNNVERSSSVLCLTVSLAIINVFSSSVKMITNLEYHMFNIVLKEIEIVSLFFSIIVLIYGIFYLFNETATMRYAIIPIILFGFVSSLAARNKAIKMIYPPRP